MPEPKVGHVVIVWVGQVGGVWALGGATASAGVVVPPKALLAPPPPSGWQGVYLGSINTDLSAEECYSALLCQYVAGTTLTKPTLPHQTHLQVPELRP